MTTSKNVERIMRHARVIQLAKANRWYATVDPGDEDFVAISPLHAWADSKDAALADLRYNLEQDFLLELQVAAAPTANGLVPPGNSQLPERPKGRSPPRHPR